MKNGTQKGNAFLYILIAIALFGALTLIITRGQDNGEMAFQDNARLRVNAQKLLDYTKSAQQTVFQMFQTGTDLDELDLVLPSDGAYNTAPLIHKLFHSGGGGLILNTMSGSDYIAQNISSPDNGWSFQKMNADWTATTATDLFMLHVNTDPPLCAMVNKMIRNDETIPVVSATYYDDFLAGSGTLAQADCPDCATYTAICVVSGGRYGVFVTLATR